SRVTRVLVGDHLLGNAMILEHRADRYTYAPLLEIVLRTVGRLFGLSIVQLDIMATAVLPAIVFVPVRAMTRVFAMAVIGALALTFGHYLIAEESPLLPAVLQSGFHSAAPARASARSLTRSSPCLRSAALSCLYEAA